MTPAASIIAAARAAAPQWRERGVRARARLIGVLRRSLAARREVAAAVIATDTGKPALEALINEVLPSLETLRYHERYAAGILAPRRRRGGLLFPRSRFHVEYRPRGVVLVLAPYNLPFQLALAPAVAALAAGNAVVVKVSERTPGIAPLLEELFAGAGFPPGVVTVLTGDAAAGEALVRAQPDLALLTGSTATGRRVLELAAATLTPVILELGGKDPMIVLADAPFERAVDAAVYGACANAGQVCVAVQRVYVERPLFGRFVAATAARAARVRLGADMGPLISAAHAARFEALVADAVARGAVLHTGASVRGSSAEPAVLTGVTDDMRIMQEETFGPALPIVPVEDEAEAIRRANASPYGLSASVWTADLAKGRRVAAQLEAGSVAVNDVLKHIGNPDLPFGGSKQSGIGVYRGPEGVRAFCRPVAVTVNPGKARSEPNWFPYDAAKARRIDLLIALRYEPRALLARVWRTLVAPTQQPRIGASRAESSR
jgi:acyl-CoA reductase-like NAD-dependent aldehyde dehydrogenase